MSKIVDECDNELTRVLEVKVDVPSGKESSTKFGRMSAAIGGVVVGGTVGVGVSSIMADEFKLHRFSGLTTDVALAEGANPDDEVREDINSELANRERTTFVSPYDLPNSVGSGEVAAEAPVVVPDAGLDVNAADGVSEVVVLVDENGDGIIDALYVDVDAVPICDLEFAIIEETGYPLIHSVYETAEQPGSLDEMADFAMLTSGDDFAMEDFSNNSIPDF